MSNLFSWRWMSGVRPTTRKRININTCTFRCIILIMLRVTHWRRFQINYNIIGFSKPYISRFALRSKTYQQVGFHLKHLVGQSLWSTERDQRMSKREKKGFARKRFLRRNNEQGKRHAASAVCAFEPNSFSRCRPSMVTLHKSQRLSHRNHYEKVGTRKCFVAVKRLLLLIPLNWYNS